MSCHHVGLPCVPCRQCQRENSHSFLFSTNPLLPTSHPPHSSPCQAIEPSKPLLPLSSHQTPQSPPPPVELSSRPTPFSQSGSSNFLFIVALVCLHCRVFLHLVGCQVAWWPLSASHHGFASFFIGWLLRRLIGFVHCPSFDVVLSSHQAIKHLLSSHCR